MTEKQARQIATERPGGAPFVNHLPKSVIQRFEKEQEEPLQAAATRETEPESS